MWTSGSFLLVLSLITAASSAQTSSINIGDTAPPLLVKEWLKGGPIQSFEKGRVYVVELFTTWCAPCRAAMPHLSDIADKYKRQVTVVGIDLKSMEIASRDKVKKFVDSMGNTMNYQVAMEDSNYIAASWYEATGEWDRGIPKSFIIDRDGKIAWIGHPIRLEEALSKVVNKQWDLEKALAKRNLDRYIDSLDGEAYFRLYPYRQTGPNKEEQGKPELALLAINSMVINEPELKYALHMSIETFASLLKTDWRKALEYGRECMVKPGSRYHGSQGIIMMVEWYADKMNIPPDIYCLAGEAYEAFIDWLPYAQNSELQDMYKQMAKWYAKGNKKSKAVNAMKKAIGYLKKQKDYSAKDLAAYQSSLQQYRKM